MSRSYRQRMLKGGSLNNETEDLNPMNYTGNLADAMLVLAVGIMLALVMVFKVNLAEINADAEAQNAEQIEEAEKLKASADEDTVEIEDSDLTEYGKVYMDTDGNLYVIEN